MWISYGAGNYHINAVNILVIHSSAYASGTRIIVVPQSKLLITKSLPPRQNGHHIADDIFRAIFANEKFCIFIKISLKFILNDPTDNNPTVGWIMAWRRKGDKPLSDSMLFQFTDAYMRHLGEMS